MKLDTQQQAQQQALQAMRDLSRVGLTTVVDAGGFDTTDELYLPFIALAEQADLPLRTLFLKQLIPWGGRDLTPDLSRLKDVEFHSPSQQLRFVGVGEQLYMPVQDSAGRAARSSDEVREQFARYATELAEQAVPLHLHAVNDASINQHLDIFSQINRRIPLAPLRWTLAHVDGIQPATVERAKQLGINLAIHSRPVLIGYRFQSSFGAAKAATMTPMAELERQGITWGLGSDSPVVSIYNPFYTLWWAVTGRMVDETQISDMAVTRQQALVAHTRSNAYLAFMEDEIGSLERGKSADLVVLDRDYFSVPVEQIRAIKPLATLSQGRWVYRADEF